MNELLKTYIKKENNLFQSQIWQSYQSSLENDTFWVNCNDGDVLVIKLPLYKKMSYLYCPRAPHTTEEGWKLFLNKVKEIAKRENAIFIRVEPFVVSNGILKELKFSKINKYSPMSKQFSPMDTMLLDITSEENELLEKMKPKWRYNIRLAEKKGVKVRTSTSEKDLKAFYNLSVGMKKRGYSSHDYEHYKLLLKSLVEKENAKLFVAEHEKEIISVLFVTFYNEIAIYLHGASSDNKRDLMPNHLAQWEAIRAAKKAGCKIYDFWGIAPEGAINHEWSGISRFKQGFGGESVHFIGAFDYTFSKFWYIMFCLANFVRKVIKR